jgi:HK97 family phage portal protein
MTDLPSSGIERSIINVPVPRGQTNLTIIGRRGEESQFAVSANKRDRYATYYEMYKQHPTVRAAVEKIAKTAVANGYRLVPSGDITDVPARKKKVLAKFFRESNASQLLRATYRDLLIYGESFWLVVGAKANKPERALRLHPEAVEPKIAGGVLTGWKYNPLVRGLDSAIEYEEREILHFVMDDPQTDTGGLSLLESLKHTVASDLFAMKFNTKFFENAASSGLIFVMKLAQKEEVDRNREWLEQNYAGPDNAHRPMLLEGDIEVKKAVGTRQEMQFIEGRRFNRQEILTTLDIDPTKLGISDTANRSVSKEADNSFRSETISPLQVIVEEEVSNSLIARLFGYEDILFEQEESSLRDRLDLINIFAAGERMGVFSINDILRDLGRPTVEGGDVHFIQTAAGLLPIDMIETVAERLVAGTVSGLGTAVDPLGADQQVTEPAGATNSESN